jgi:hypothetical protein
MGALPRATKQDGAGNREATIMAEIVAFAVKDWALKRSTQLLGFLASEFPPSISSGFTVSCSHPGSPF